MRDDLKKIVAGTKDVMDEVLNLGDEREEEYSDLETEGRRDCKTFKTTILHNSMPQALCKKTCKTKRLNA